MALGYDTRILNWSRCDVLVPYEVLDPRPFAASAPYTYFLPDLELLRAIGAGDHVKAMIRAVPPSEKYDAERMWIRINSVEVDWFEGELDSEPQDMPSLPRGSTIRLPLLYAIDAIISDPLRAAALSTKPPRREYWDRCLVDQAILDGDLTVEYIYREALDMAKEGDEFPDSGWRIRGDTRVNRRDQIGSRKVAYVALGAVLNRDDSWLHLIDEPIGARFEKDYGKGKFVQEK
jgi:hypothetical protein